MLFRKTLRGMVVCFSLACCLLVISRTADAALYYKFLELPSFDASDYDTPEEAAAAQADYNDNIAIAANQIYLELSEGPEVNGTYHVNFRILNVGADRSSVTQVYFEDGHLLNDQSTAVISHSDGVDFSPTDLTDLGDGTNPNSVGPPGSQNIGFGATAGFNMSSDATSPVYANGVGNTPDGGEWVNFDFGLQNDKIFDDVTYDLSLQDPNSTLRIAIHVQGFANGGSVSMILDGGNPVEPPDTASNGPEPTALAVWGLLGAGAAGIGAARRRRRGRWSDAERQAIRNVVDRHSV